MANVKQIKQKTTGTLLNIEDTQARGDIAAEVTNRTNADKALDDKVKAETEARTSAYNALNQKIVQETTNRTNADNALQEKINTNKNDISELKDDLVNICERTNQLLDWKNAEVLEAYISNGTIINSVGTKTVLIPVDGTNHESVTVHKMLTSRYVISAYAEHPTNGSIGVNTRNNEAANILTINLEHNTEYIAVFFYHSRYDTDVTIEEILETMMVQYGNKYTGYEHYYQPLGNNEFRKGIADLNVEIEPIKNINNKPCIEQKEISGGLLTLPHIVGDTLFHTNSKDVANVAILNDYSVVYATSIGELHIVKNGTDTLIKTIDGADQWRGFYVAKNGDLFVSPYHCTDTSNNGIWKLNSTKDDFVQVHQFTEAGNESTIWTFAEDEIGNLYGGVYDQKINTPYILKSVDGGLTWSTIVNFATYFNISSMRHVHCIYYDKYNKTLYASLGEGDYNYKSSDGGVTWVKILNGIGKMTAITSTPYCRIFGTDVGAIDSVNDTDILSAKIYITKDDVNFELVQEFWSMDIFGFRVSDVTGYIYAYTIVDSAVNDRNYFPPREAIDDMSVVTSWKATNPSKLSDWLKQYNKWKDIYPEDCIVPQHSAILVSRDGGHSWEVLAKLKHTKTYGGFYSASELKNGEVAFCGKCDITGWYYRAMFMKENSSGFKNGLPNTDDAIMSVIS